MPADDLTPLHESFFKTIYDRYKDRLYGYILAIVHSEDAAEDITHELFARIWTSRQSLGHVNNIDHYLFAIARNKSLNYLRKAKNDARIMARLKEAMQPGHNAVDDYVAVSEYTKLLREAVEKLSPQRKLVFNLSRQQGKKIEEIASEMSLSKNTVKNHLVEALRFIRSYFAKHGITYFLLFILHTG